MAEVPGLEWGGGGGGEEGRTTQEGEAIGVRPQPVMTAQHLQERMAADLAHRLLLMHCSQQYVQQNSCHSFL